MSRKDYNVGDNQDLQRKPRIGGGGRALSNPGEKPKSFRKSWGRLLRFAAPHKWQIIVALLCGLVIAAALLIAPRLLSRLVGIIEVGLTGAMDVVAMRRMIITLAAVYVINALTRYTQSFLMVGVTQQLAYRLRHDVSRKINSVPLNFFNRASFGDILSRVTNDVDGVSEALNQGVATLLEDVTIFVGSMIMMLITNVWMALTAVATTALGFLLMTLIIKVSRRYFVAQQRDLGRMNGHVEEVYAGHNVIKAYNNEDDVRETFDEINRALQTSAFKSQTLSTMMMPLMNFVGNISYVAVSILGAVLAMRGKIPFAVIVAFMMYIRLFSQPLQSFAQIGTRLQSAAAAAERIFEFLDEPDLEDESHKTAYLAPEDVVGALEFDHVRFRYEGMEDDVIRDFTATVAPGMKVAIVGPTGAGKTTMINLLMRFYEIDDGAIRLDGCDIRNLTRSNVRDLFCMVLQDSWLFEGTLRDNITYGRPDVSDEELVRVCKLVGVHHFIETLPEGYDTVVSDEISISEGQKQQLTIARAMIENAPMLILDEATSSIDTRTEALIQHAMDQLMENRTSIVIAHRLSTIRDADLILVMGDGTIIERGNHHDLIELDGFYANMYKSQFDA